MFTGATSQMKSSFYSSELSSSMDFDILPSFTGVDMTSSSSGIVLPSVHTSSFLLSSASPAPLLDLSVLNSSTSASSYFHRPTAALKDPSSYSSYTRSSFSSAYVKNSNVTYSFSSEYSKNEDVQLSPSATESAFQSLATVNNSFALDNFNNIASSFLSEFMTNNVHNEYKTSYLIPNSPISATETFHNVGVELISSNWHDNAHSKLPSSVTERGTIGDNLNTISPPSSLGFGLKNEENLIVTNTVDSMNSVFQSSMPYLAQHSSTEETSILQTGMVQHLESVVQTLASNISSTIPLPQRALSIELSTEAPRNALTTMQMSDHKPSLISLDLFSTVVSHTSKEDALSHTRGSAVFSPQITTNTLVGEGEVPFNADIFGDTQLEDLLNAILSERQQSESSSLISDNIIRNKTTKTTSGLVPISTQLEMSEYIHSKGIQLAKYNPSVILSFSEILSRSM